jgi:NADH-quinone oxidoreductase E subunit
MDKTKKILANYPGQGRDKLIPILQDIQDAYGYLSEESISKVAKYLHLPTSKIFGVATFYNQFRFEPKGKYHIQVCRGTACHVSGSSEVLDELKKVLKIDADQTTKDGLFSLEVVACIGACGLAPVIAVNEKFHAKVSKDNVKEIIDNYRSKEEKENG